MGDSWWNSSGVFKIQFLLRGIKKTQFILLQKLKTQYLINIITAQVFKCHLKDNNCIGIIEIERRKAKEMSGEIETRGATRSMVVCQGQVRRHKLYQ